MAEQSVAQTLVVCVPIGPDGRVGHSWGKAPAVALAVISDGAIVGWSEHAVGWDALHDEGTEGSHHARVVRFLREHDVAGVASAHMGPPMQNTLAKLGIAVDLGAQGDARTAALAVAARLERPHRAG